MPSIGAGVSLDNAAPPVRITFYDTASPDAQNDGLGNFSYDHHKIWACMGRVGVNGVMRAGFVEEGNPFTGAAAGWIEPNAGGVFGGVNQWNALTAYDPTGGPATNDYCIYGALEPFGGIMLHLDAPLAGQPAFIMQYWTGAWTTIALTVTPDFTQAGGYANQRAQWAFFGLSPAPVAAVIGSSVNPYYFWRILRTAPDAYGAPQANIAYKDYLYGHFKRWWAQYDLKRGDDGAGSAPTSFNDPGPFNLAFRHTFAVDGARTNQAQNVTIGEKTTQTTRPSPMLPWVIQQNNRKGLRNYNLFGGAIMGIGDNAAGSVTILKAGGNAEILCCLISGYGNVSYGAASTAALDSLQDVFIVATPDSAQRTVFTISATRGGNIGIYTNQRAPSGALGPLRFSAPTAVKGLRLNDDRYDTLFTTRGQVYKSGSGRNHLVDFEWGGPAGKVAPNSLVSVNNELIEYRRLHILVHEDGTNTPPPAGMPVRITGSDGVVQTLPGTTLDALGECNFDNVLGEPFTDPVSGNRMVWASVWRGLDGSGNAIEEVLDEPLKVEINPSDLAGHNSDFVTVTVYMRFPRDEFFNLDTATWERAEWQRTDASLMLGLKRSAIVPITSDEVALPESSELRYEGVVPEMV